MKLIRVTSRQLFGVSSLRQEARAFSERGSVMSEGAISLSALIILMIGVFDLGSALNQQLTVSRIAYEGARYGSSLAGLEQCTASCSSLPLHGNIITRLRTLLTQSGFNPVQAQLVTTFNSTSREIMVSVSYPYRSVFPASFVNNTYSEVRSSHLFPQSS